MFTRDPHMTTDIKTYRFGAITSTGSYTSFNYSTFPIVGEVIKVIWDYGAPIDANGSVWLAVSGTVGEEIHRINGFGADAVAYPGVYNVNNVNTTGSPYAFSKRTVSDVLYVAGSGLGSPYAAITNVTVVYR